MLEFLRGRDVISILDFDRRELEEIFEAADEAPRLARARPLRGRILALAFLEPSTRTRMSFESAMKRLGGDTILLENVEASSIAKGENLADTIRMLDAYADAIVLRSRYEGAALFAAEIAESPVINGGDGRQHHPTQAMIDLYTIRKLFGGVDGLTIGVLGDLRYGRAAASFLLGLTRFRPKRVYAISPPQLRPRRELVETLKSLGLSVEDASLEDVLGELDVLYVTRIQRERFPDPGEYERVRGSYRVTLDMLERHAKRDLKVLHPLPRVDEIDHRVDESRFQAYFTQARLGVPLRMALLLGVMGGDGL